MKKLLTIGIATCMMLLSCSRHESLTSLVNPFVGTDGHGHTYPGAIVPFGMIQPGPDTRLEGWDGCSGYHYSDDTIYGFSQTHLSGTGVEDFCDVLIMPVDASFATPESHLDKTQYRSHFSHKNEKAEPGYYSVHLDKNNVDVEISCDQRKAVYRFNYATNDGNGFVIDLQHRDKLLNGHISLDGEMITGNRESASWSPDQKLYFAIKSEQPIKSLDIINDSTQAVVRFADGTNKATLWVAISAVDVDGAKKNNAGPWPTFEQMRNNADSVWNEALSHIKVKGGTKEERKCFYTALYHCMTAPYLFSDIDGRYRGQDDIIHQTEGKHEVYTVFSLWDTYRALHPLLTLIDRKRTEDFIYTMLKHYEQGGETTMWELAGHETHCMIGYHAAPVILEALMAGYLDQWPESWKNKRLEGMMVTSNLKKFGRAEYAMQGYLSSEIDNESVSKTLEYAYDDWCIAQYAEQIGTVEQEATYLNHIYDNYMKRAQSWKNIMDTDGFMHPRRNGGFMTPFNPTEINNNYTEGNSWQYSTYVPHDVYGWIERIGGKDAAERFLDSLFYGSSSLSGRDQADVTGLIGQYAHGNEPSHHAAYLYTYVGKPEKTQKLVNQVLSTLYNSKPEGLCGNEDCGQMSAWYVMSSIGLYPVCPGSGEYVTVEPLFKEVSLKLADGSTLNINPKAWRAGMFWRGGKFYDTSVSTTDKHYCTTTIPYFTDWRQRFDSIRQVEIATYDDAKIYYTLDGSIPDTNSTLYNSPITIDHDAVITAIAYTPLTGYSKAVSQNLTYFNADKRLTYITKPDPQYYENGEEGLVDHLFGKINYRIGGWQGWQGDMEVVVDLLASRSLRSVGISCLEDTRSWIFYPTGIEVSTSEDGKDYRPFANVSTNYIPIASAAGTTGTRIFYAKGNTHARYVKLKVKNFGKMPNWHVSAGEQAWLFVDEILIN